MQPWHPLLLDWHPLLKFCFRVQPHRVQAKDWHVCVLQGAPEVGGCLRLHKDRSMGVSGSPLFHPLCILFLLLSLTSPSLLTDIPFWNFASRFNPHRVQARDGHVCVLQGAPEVGGCPRLSKDHSVGVSGSTFFHPLCSVASFFSCFHSHPLLLDWHPFLKVCFKVQPPQSSGQGWTCLCPSRCSWSRWLSKII